MLVRLKYTLLLGLSVISCAKFVPPTGGDRDTTPPKLVDSIPKNKTTNYSDQTIWLKFDEYVDSKDLKRELIITPQPESKYKVKNKGDEVTLSFENKLDSNTTYTFNFGGGIKDINERNKSDKIKIVFSTGDKLDSLSIEGLIENLFTKEPIIEATVALYDIDKKDSIIITQCRPTYFVKTDSSGKYRFENLKRGKYKVLSFTDSNKNIRFDNKKELFSFRADTLDLNRDTLGINLELYPYDTIAPKYKRFIQKETIYTLKFDESLYKPNVRFLADSVNYTVEDDEIRFFKGITIVKDSIEVEIELRDSLANTDLYNHKFIFRSQTGTEKEKPEVVQFKVTPTSGKPIVQNEQIEFAFDYPISIIDSSKIVISDDTLNTIDYQIYFLNNSRTKIKIELKDEISKSVVIKAKAGAFINIRSDSTTAFTISNPIIKISETGLLAGTVKNDKVDSTQYIFQLMNFDTGKVVDEKLSLKNEFLFNNLLPNQYFIRIILDENFNGLWDTARFKEGRGPEQVIVQKTPIKVKANFEFRDILIEN
jgi:uncharacterized protein (DUF2141 family)